MPGLHHFRKQAQHKFMSHPMGSRRGPEFRTQARGILLGETKTQAR